MADRAVPKLCSPWEPKAGDFGVDTGTVSSSMIPIELSSLLWRRMGGAVPLG